MIFVVIRDRGIGQTLCSFEHVSCLVMNSRNPSRTNISHQQNSRKIIFTGLVLMPTVSAIRCTMTRRFCRTAVSTARQFSSQTASDGRFDLGSHSKLFLPRRNSIAQRFTVAYDGASSPYTTVIWLRICCGETFSNVKNSYHCTIANSVEISHSV